MQGRLCPDRRDQRGDADEVHDALQVVGQDVQGHFGGDLFQRLHLEVGRAHLELDGAEGMLDRLSPLVHLLLVLVEPLLDGLEDIFVLPAGHPALLARGATMLEDAALAGRAKYRHPLRPDGGSPALQTAPWPCCPR